MSESIVGRYRRDLCIEDMLFAKYNLSDVYEYYALTERRQDFRHSLLVTHPVFCSNTPYETFGPERYFGFRKLHPS